MLEVGWWGSLRDLSKNILKAKVARRGEGGLKVSPGGGFEVPTHNISELSENVYF